jgi:predicted transcriptional regulator
MQLKSPTRVRPNRRVRRVRVTVCLLPELVSGVDRIAYQHDDSRSRFIEQLIIAEIERNSMIPAQLMECPDDEL